MGVLSAFLCALCVNPQDNLPCQSNVCDAYAFGSAFGVCCLSLGHALSFGIKCLAVSKSSAVPRQQNDDQRRASAHGLGDRSAGAHKSRGGPDSTATLSQGHQEGDGQEQEPRDQETTAAQGEQTKPKHGETHGVGLSEPVPGQQCPREGREEGPVTYRLTPYAATQACAILRIAKGKRHKCSRPEVVKHPGNDPTWLLSVTLKAFTGYPVRRTSQKYYIYCFTNLASLLYHPKSLTQ